MNSTNSNINYFIIIGAEFWYRKIGVNVFPADTINKKPLVDWKQWQNKPLPHIAAGDTNNDQLTNCRICSCNGWPHESITFHKVNGRALSSGGNEVKEWIIHDYFKGNKHHVHKQKRGGPR